MGIRRLAIAFLIVLSTTILDDRPVQALEPITDALLDRADRNAKDVIARAEAAGDAMAKAVGEQVLKAIAALREAVHSSIGDEKDAYIQSQRETYGNISKILDQARDVEKASMTDVAGLLAIISDEVGNLPFVDMPPAVMLYQPRVLVPEGVSEVPVRVIGPKLSASDPEVTFNDASVRIQKSRDVEVIALLDRKTMNFSEREPHYVPVRIRYDQTRAIWWKPWTWSAHDVVSRDMTLLMLPRIMGHFAIRTKVNSTVYAHKEIPRHAGGHGMDNSMNVQISPDPPDLEEGWRIDVTALRDEKGNPKLTYSTSGGDDGASCSGMLASTLTPEGFDFVLTHGHKTDWAGHKSDVDVQCEMRVPLVKATPVVLDGPTIEGDIGWSNDVRRALPAGLESYIIALRLFNSREYLLDADAKVPYGLVEITRAKTYVQFRPVPPADF